MTFADLLLGTPYTPTERQGSHNQKTQHGVAT